MGKYLEHGPRALAIATFIVLTLTVTHELGYFGTIGHHYQSLVSTSDYLNIALNWLPSFIIIWTLLILLEVAARAGTYEPRPLPLVFHLLGVPILFFAVVAFFMGGDNALTVQMYTLAALYLLNMVSGVLIKSVSANKNAVISVGIVLIAAIPLIIAYGHGAVSARADLVQSKSDYTITLNDVPVEVVMLRTMEKGILWRLPTTTKVEYRRWDEVKAVSKSVELPRSSLSCRLFGVMCR